VFQAIGVLPRPGELVLDVVLNVVHRVLHPLDGIGNEGGLAVVGGRMRGIAVVSGGVGLVLSPDVLLEGTAAARCEVMGRSVGGSRLGRG
jgi:hypothetical protein